MNLFKTALLILTLTFSSLAVAQTADEIIAKYIEVIGGQDAWSKISSMQVTGIAKQQGTDYSFTATYMSNGKTMIAVDMQGNNFVVEAFDGETGWNTNFQTFKAEAMDAEASSNYKLDSKDNLPNAFFNYKDKGYSIKFLGKDSFEGTEIYKIELTKKPLLVDGSEEENIDLYYFDINNHVPIAVESVVKTGQAKGATSQTLFSNYQEVEGLYVPFSQVDKFNGQVALEINFKTFQFNPEIDDNMFKMPKN